MNTIADQLVSHERFITIRNAVQHVWERAQQGDRQILPIIGPTRVGKSKMLSRFAHPRMPSSTGGDRKVVFIMTPKHLTGRSLIDACLAGIGMRPDLFRNHEIATQAFIRAANKLGTELFIFDEIQHILERGRGSELKKRDAADLLKRIFDQKSASLVIAGLPTLTGLFEHNEQLADRARRAVEFFPYHWEGQDYRHFRGALAGALGYFVEHGWQTVSASDAEFARRMYVATAGRYGLINKILVEVQTLTARTKVAGYAEFSAAYRSGTQNRLIKLDPFDLSQTIQTEHLALVYTQIMQEAGVSL
jgi:hypothetical protein